MAGPWRPRPGRPVGSIVEAVYGLLLATAVIAVSREYDAANAGLVGVTVLVTASVFYLAHVYSRLLAGWIAHRRTPSRPQVREALRHDWPLVEVTIPLVVILALGVLDVVPDRAAVRAAALVALAELALAGGYAARGSGASVLGTVASAAVAAALGSVVVVLKALVH